MRLFYLNFNLFTFFCFILDFVTIQILSISFQFQILFFFSTFYLSQDCLNFVSVLSTSVRSVSISFQFDSIVSHILFQLYLFVIILHLFLVQFCLGLIGFVSNFISVILQFCVSFVSISITTLSQFLIFFVFFLHLVSVLFLIFFAVSEFC